MCCPSCGCQGKRKPTEMARVQEAILARAMSKALEGAEFKVVKTGTLQLVARGG